MMMRLSGWLSIVFAWILARSSVAHAAVQPEAGWGLPRDVSVEGFGSEIDWLIQITLVFVTILFVIMVVWMLYACLRHNKNHQAEHDHGESKHSIKVALVISAVIFFIVDGNLWVKSTKDINGMFWNFASAEAEQNVVRIEVNAHQWAWDIRYPGPDGKFNTKDDIITLNDVRVPLGAPVVFQLGSTDVIHSFYLPNLRVKQDAVPGMVNRLWFKAKEPGEFDIACAQHCGVNHYKMKAKLTVLSQEDFAAWAAEASHISSVGFDEADKEAHWGWEWRPI